VNPIVERLRNEEVPPASERGNLGEAAGVYAINSDENIDKGRLIDSLGFSGVNYTFLDWISAIPPDAV